MFNNDNMSAIFWNKMKMPTVPWNINFYLLYVDFFTLYLYSNKKVLYSVYTAPIKFKRVPVYIPLNLTKCAYKSTLGKPIVIFKCTLGYKTLPFIYKMS